jgi:hypothetical protein
MLGAQNSAKKWPNKLDGPCFGLKKPILAFLFLAWTWPSIHFTDDPHCKASFWHRSKKLFLPIKFKK